MSPLASAGGSGLKHRIAPLEALGLPSLRRGEWIETLNTRCGKIARRKVSPRAGGVDETTPYRWYSPLATAGGVEKLSPRFGGGSGLKLCLCLCHHGDNIQVSPRFGGGSGLKLVKEDDANNVRLVSPLASAGGVD